VQENLAVKNKNTKRTTDRSVCVLAFLRPITAVSLEVLTGAGPWPARCLLAMLWPAALCAANENPDRKQNTTVYFVSGSFFFLSFFQLLETETGRTGYPFVVVNV
jgi:hypothetical protein